LKIGVEYRQHVYNILEGRNPSRLSSREVILGSERMQPSEINSCSLCDVYDEVEEPYYT